MKLALDAMGGDDAPTAMVQGAVDYARAHPQHTVILVGIEADVRASLAKQGAVPANIAVEHAPQVIGMAEKLAALKEKPDDSMNRCAQLVKRGAADAMVLCGNTGCSVGAAQLHLKRVPGVKRAGILAPLPTPKDKTWVCDVGANAVSKPEYLVQFAEMTSTLLEHAYGRPKPRIGVLSIGEEEEKGTELTHGALDLLKKTSLNVIGNVEGHDIFSGGVDIVVCDGFTGNVVLKTAEGLADGVVKIIKEEVMSGGLRTKLGALLFKPVFRGFHRRTHWSLIGGCPLIGVDGVTIIGHGRSNRVAVYHALAQAARYVEGRFIERIRERYKATASDPAIAPG